MWCVVHVKDGEEMRAEEFVSGLLPKSLNARCFHLTRDRRKKYGGKWQTIHEKLFPGYVFISTDQPEKVHKKLKQAPKPRLLFSNDECVSTLKEHEVDFMERITGDGTSCGIGEIAISKVKVTEAGSVECLSGPLLHVGSMVRKIDLHKRIAEVEADFMGQRQALYLGIEIER